MSISGRQSVQLCHDDDGLLRQVFGGFAALVGAVEHRGHQVIVKGAGQLV